MQNKMSMSDLSKWDQSAVALDTRWKALQWINVTVISAVKTVC